MFRAKEVHFLVTPRKEGRGSLFPCLEIRGRGEGKVAANVFFFHCESRAGVSRMID